MALCRARPLFGSDKARARTGTVIADVTRGTPRDPSKLREDVLAMRAGHGRSQAQRGAAGCKTDARRARRFGSLSTTAIGVTARAGPGWNTPSPVWRQAGHLPDLYVRHHLDLTRPFWSPRACLRPMANGPRPPLPRHLPAPAAARIRCALHAIAGQGMACHAMEAVFGQQLEIDA